MATTWIKSRSIGCSCFYHALILHSPKVCFSAKTVEMENVKNINVKLFIFFKNIFWCLHFSAVGLKLTSIKIFYVKKKRKKEYRYDWTKFSTLSLNVMLGVSKTNICCICCIFRPAFGCCALQTLVKIVIFSVFYAKNLKKQEICSKFLKKQFFLSLHQNAGRLFYSKKMSISTSVWSAQHPNAGWNIQQTSVSNSNGINTISWKYSSFLW